MPITLKEYWLALQQSLQDFDKGNPCAAKDDADKKCYQTQRAFLEKLAELGIHFENASLFSKSLLAHGLKAFPEKTLGKEKMITTLDGPLSTSFAEQVYLPHIERFQEVHLNNQYKIIKAIVDLEQEKAEAATAAEKLKALIEKYKSSPSPLIALSTFAPAQAPAKAEEKQLQASAHMP